MERRTVWRGKFLEMATIGSWEFVHRIRGKTPGGAVGIVAVTPQGKMLLISQYRIPVGKRIIEIPAGLVGDRDQEETWQVAAERELREETGWQATTFEKLTQGPTSAGLTSECITLVRATGLVKQGAPQPDGNEHIEVHEIKLDDVPAWLRKQEAAGVMIDPKVWAGLYFAVAKG
ncbi:MAG: NUDIX hydrolase [Phycisphaerales bacterium]|nr:NUDIX hydrolase [Phycisphaerales bacterium]